LNQNLHASERLYSEREAGSRLLLGPKFNLLRREFNAWRGWQREIRPTANRLLVAMGGSDPRDLNSLVYKAIRSIGDNRGDNSIAVRIATGSINPRIATLRAMAADSQRQIQLEVDADMPDLMRWADMAIAAAGATCWEICMLGLPALLIDAAENQTSIARSLADANAAVHLGNWREMTAENIAAAIEGLRLSQERRHMLSRNARSLVDGNGAARVVDEIRRFDRDSSDCELEPGRCKPGVAQTQ
jgi:spore coat polysaccharide biosynthesis predicted glycosyltransferase SpsG